MLELVAREPHPFVEYLDSGKNHLRRAEVFGDGVEEHRTRRAFDIAFEMFPERKENYRQQEDGSWEYK